MNLIMKYALHCFDISEVAIYAMFLLRAAKMKAKNSLRPIINDDKFNYFQF